MVSAMVLVRTKQLLVKGKMRDVTLYLRELSEQNSGKTLQAYIDHLRQKPDR